jgi:hypothetical protein
MKASLMAVEAAPGAEKTPTANSAKNAQPSSRNSLDKKSADPHVQRFRLPDTETRIARKSLEIVEYCLY